MAFNYNEALAELTNPANAGKYSTLDGLLSLVREVSIAVPGEQPGAVTLLYSGSLTGSVRTGDVAALLAKDGSGNIRVIDSTEVAKLLTSEVFKNFAIEAAGSEAGANSWLFDAKNGAWADTSRRFVAAASGDIVTMTAFAADNRVFAVTELPAALDNPAVRSINGIPKEVLLFIRDAAAAEGPEAALLAVKNAVGFGSATTTAEMRLSLDAEGKLVAVDTGRLFEGTTYDGQKLSGDKFASSVSVATESADLAKNAQQSLTSGAKSLNDGLRAAGLIEYAGKALNTLGTIAVAASYVSAVADAKAASDAGDIDRAQRIMVEWTAKTEGGLVAGYLVGSVVGEALAPLLLLGPLGQGAWLVATVAAGAGGAYLGSEAVAKLLSDDGGTTTKVPSAVDSRFFDTVTDFSNGSKLTQFATGGVDDNGMLHVLIGPWSQRWDIPGADGGTVVVYQDLVLGASRQEVWSGKPGESTLLSRTDIQTVDGGGASIKNFNGGQFVSEQRVSTNEFGGTTVQTFDNSQVLQKTLIKIPSSGSVEIVQDDPSDATRTTTTVRDGEGQVTGIREQQTEGLSLVVRNYDPEHRLLNTGTTTKYDDGSRTEQITYPDGGSVTRTYDENRQLVSTTATQAPLTAFGTAITDINSLVQSIRSGQPLPILSSGLRLLNNQINPPIGGSAVVTNQPLFTATAVVGAINSVYGLVQAFDHGNFADQVSATASAVYAVDAAVKAVTGAAEGVLSQGASQAIGQAVPYLGAVAALSHGDYTGAAISIIAYNVPVVGWIYAAYSIFTAMNDEPPEAWGMAHFKFTDGTHLGVDSAGEGMGIGRVEFLMQGNGLAATNPDGTPNPNYFGGLEGYLNDLIARATQANPDDALGIIPQRLPTLTWHEARQDNPGYSLVDIDPITGEERYPGLRYNDDFSPINADATDPAQRRDLFQRMVDSALEHQAIAPMWEVRTARLQQDGGDPDAGLTEEERAARHGLSASADANGQKLPGKFRPVVLDLNGDGSITTVTNAASDVTFDWDDSGYVKQTGWIGSGEGFLVIDRNLNGAADSGKELFSNSLVSDAAKGIRGMAWVDANGDGVLDASDPVFAALSVWQDANQDGVQEASETHLLADLGITKLDYANSRFTRNGQEYSLQSPDLEASNDGVRVNVVQGGIQVDYSDGRSTLFVTQVIDLGGGSGQGTNFTAHDDGFTSWEDGTPPGADAAHPTSQAPGAIQPISIAWAQLLANDAFNGSNAGLTITALGASLHGSAQLNLDQGTVEFTPEHNYAGQASFEYTVTAADGQTRTAKAIIDLQAVNDSPSLTVALIERPVYGYGVFAHTETLSSGGENGYEYRVTVEPDAGVPQYAAYYTVAGRTVTYVEQGGDSGGSYAVYGPYVDTLIPRDYFDRQYGPILAQQSTPDSPAPTSVTIVINGQTYVVDAAPQMYLHDTQIGTETSNDGQVSASDPDGAGQFRYEVQQDGLYGHAVIDANTGQFTYTGRRYTVQDLVGNAVNQNVDTDEHTRYEERQTDVFQVKVVDLSDPSGNTFTIQDVSVTHFGPLPMPNVASGGKKPIAVDLNGDGFHFTDVDDSNVFYDVNGDGWRRKIAWNNPSDGLIAYDRNGDGKIDRFDEISFVPYKPDGQTDLEGLRAFDTNGDGVFSAADEKWSSFGVWQDANSDGVSDPGEFKSLTDLGINGIALTSDGQFRVIDGQTVRGVGAATKADGSTLALADVTLRWKNVTQGTAPDGSTGTATLPAHSVGDTFNGTADADLVFGTSGSDQYHMGSGNDVVNDDAGNDLVEAGAGDDIVFTGAGKDYVDAGDGTDSVFTGDGDDLAMGGAGDDFLAMGSGNDAAFGGDGNDLVSGGVGNDLLSGDAGDDKVFGEGGWDALFGMGGADELWGGDGNDSLNGGEGNDLLSGGAGDDAMEGGAGNDTYEVDSAADTIVELAGGGFDTVRSSINYTLGAELENLVLTGDAALQGTGNAASNTLIGNDAANTLRGLDGDDTLDGRQGADTLIGGVGNDTYIVENSGDQIVELAEEGVDTVKSTISTTLGDNVENLTLIGIASINGTGNALDNVITGNDAANRLDGGIGADRMSGGVGHDTYVVDSAGDLVIEAVGEGYDTVESHVTSYALGDNVEALVLASGATSGRGNALDNTITGNAGNNAIDGGAGADFMQGGAGDDSYIVDNVNDRVVEKASEGTDSVVSSVTYTLAANVENLTLVGAANIDGTGNELANALVGNAGNNRLDGAAGADSLTGGAGDDIYVVDDAGDQVLEAAASGTDTVMAGVDYTLTAHVENLILTGTAVSGVGNELANAITGNAANNVLDGAAGADAMAGGAGDDTYLVDNAADTAAENANEGVDTVRSSVTYALSQNVENLTLTGSANINGTGNELGNLLTGNSGSNILDGGAGGDTMVGGAGDDGYVVDDASDQVVEQPGDGFDRVGSSIDYVLAANVEQLTLTATAISGTGNDLDNLLFGNAQANLLDGAAGADAMTGAAGDDTYIVDNTADTVSESINEGVDTVRSSVSYALSANVENLVLTGASDIDGTGNELANVLTGNAGNNVLDGGAGADVMTGASGNDGYIVDNSADQVIELAGEGFDRVSSSIDYVLAANVEQLTLTGNAIRGTGNALDNLLFGNDQANILDGAGGADQMSGGLGDDRYVVDNAGDVVVEAANAGIDTIIASVSRTVEANVENLVLVGDATNGTGNELANVLVGNALGNTLSGGAGNDVLAGSLGNDTLDGGIGDDLYLYNQGEGRDTIADASGTDTLRFGAGMTLDSVAARTVTINGQSKVYISVLSTDGTEQQDQGIELPASGSIERFEFANGGVYALADLMVTTRTLNGNSSANTLTGDRRDDTINAGGGNDTVYGRWGNDTVYGGSGADKLFGEGGNDKLYGESEADQLWGGAGQDLLEGGSGADLLVGGTGNDSLNGGVDNDILDGGDGADVMIGDSGDDQLFGGAGADFLDGGTDADLLAAGDGDDVIRGGTGSGYNVIVAGAGNDWIDGGTDRDFIDGGSGNDLISTSSGSDFIAAGTGNDMINTGADRDLIAFNRGDGGDVVVGSGWDRDTLSLGGGIRYADLALRKDGNDLVLDLGSGDSVTFDDWYTDNSRRSVDTLQMVTVGGDYLAGSTDRTRNRKAVSFDFAALVARFDQVRASTPGLTSWPAGSEINTYFKASSDTTAIGGDLAYRYATTGSYGDLDWLGVRNRMGGMNGSSWQTLAVSTAVNPWTALQAGLSLVSDQTVGLPSPITPMASPTGDELAFAAMTASGRKPSWMGDQPARILP